MTTIVGKLYANWCGACKAIKEIWSDTEAKVKAQVGGEVVFKNIESENMDAELEKFNAENNTNVALQGGYPTIYKVEGTNVSYYGGDRNVDDIVKWILEKKGGKSKQSNKRKRNNKRKQTKRNKKQRR
jgi:thiol-disulfide isomerase/thioredoxin